MKVFAGGIATETNTFSPMPTGMRDYTIIRPEDDVEKGTKPAFDQFQSDTEARGWDYVFGLSAHSQPAGITTRSTYESLRDELLERLEAAMPVDIVLLGLHGAMVAEGYDDCETDIIDRVRQIVGPDVKIGVELDLHCDVTQAMIDTADAIVLYKEYPHTDVAARASDLFNIIADAAEGKTNPTMALFDCRMIGLYLTPYEPLRSFVDELLAMEGKDGILSISLVHCFPWGDVPTCGAQALAITDGDPDQAARLAEEIGRRFHGMRRELDQTPYSIDEALEQALADPTGPVVIADRADNAGGGAPSDSTFMLKAMLDRGIDNAGIATMWDPIAVQVAMSGGVGASLDIRLGGKMGPMSGDPLDLTVKVIRHRRRHVPGMAAATGRPHAHPLRRFRLPQLQWHRHHRQQQAWTAHEPGRLHKPRRRREEKAYPRGEVVPTLLCRIRADRFPDHLHGRARRRRAALHRDSLQAR